MTAWLERIFAFWALVAVCAMLIMISYTYLQPVVRAVWRLVGRVVVRTGDSG